MNKSFQPTATDIASYVQVVDKNRNGKVSVEELENFIIKYFLNPNRNWFVKGMIWKIEKILNLLRGTVNNSIIGL